MRKGIDGDGKRRWYGLYAEPDPIRTYPSRTLASNVIGFVNGEGKGVAGLEASLNEELAGTVGSEVYDRSTYGRIPLGTNVLTPPVGGTSYTLTLDADLQWFTEQRLAESIRQSGAETGIALVMNVNNGEILALAIAKTAIPGADEFNDIWGERAPLGWDPKDAVPTAKAVVALLSDWFPATTGEMIHVDGGLHSTGA